MGYENKETLDSFSENCQRIISRIIDIGLILLMAVFPLYVRNSYFDILERKYQCYYVIAVGMLGLTMLLALVMLVIDLKEYHGAHVKKMMQKLKPQNWKKVFGATDIAVLCFWITSIVSTAGSDYLYESVWGNEGRYSGLFLLTIYVAMYFLIVNCWVPKKEFIDIFLVSGLIVAFLGITDYFQLDLVHFHEVIRPDERVKFTSTIGNINHYTAYVAYLIGCAGVLYTTADDKRRSVFYYFCYLVFMTALIMGISDNGYLSTAALLGMLPVIFLRKKQTMIRYMVMLASYFSIVSMIILINHRMMDQVIGIEGVFKMFEKMRIVPVVAALLWVLTFWLQRTVAEKRYNQIGTKLSKLWCFFIIGGTAGMIILMLWINIWGGHFNLGSAENYLIFNDDWGTQRGYIWKQSVIMWKNFPVFKKIVGYGPDTFGILAMRTIKDDMVAKTNQIYDNAHNEYLQTLVTLGVSGLISYMLILITAFKAMGKKMMTHPYIGGCLGAILCYAVQELVNFPLPIVTPMMWILLSIGMAGGKNTDKN